MPMNANRRAASTWLWRYQQALREERCLRERIKAARTRAERCTQALQPVVSHGSSPGSAIEHALELMEQYQQQLAEQIIQTETVRAEIEAALNTLPDLQRSAAKARYIDGLPIWRVANRLNISEVYAKKLLAAGLDALQTVYSITLFL